MGRSANIFWMRLTVERICRNSGEANDNEESGSAIYMTIAPSGRPGINETGTPVSELVKTRGQHIPNDFRSESKRKGKIPFAVQREWVPNECAPR